MALQPKKSKIKPLLVIESVHSFLWDVMVTHWGGTGIPAERVHSPVLTGSPGTTTIPKAWRTETLHSFPSEDVSNCREHSSWDLSAFPVSPLICLVETFGTICCSLICVVVLADDGWISILTMRIYYAIRATLLGSQLETEGWLGSSPSSDNSLSSIKSLF